MKSISTLERQVERDTAKSRQGEPGPSEVLEQLEKIATSVHFRNSKRYPAFLRYVVEHTLAGRTDVLKERTLGIEVFGRPTDYDTNTDPVVRVTAGEIRKRIAQFYQAAGQHELRIELPVGSYIPQFFSPVIDPGFRLRAAEEQGEAPAQDIQVASTEPAASPSQEGAVFRTAAHPLAERTVDKPQISIIWISVICILTLIAVGVALGVRLDRTHAPGPGIDYFWNPIFSTDTPALIVMGVHTLDANGNDLAPSTYAGSPWSQQQNMLSSMIRSDMVPVSDVVSYGQLARLLAQNAHLFRTQAASATTFEQLQRNPVVLVGGLNNVWTLRLTSTLRYRFGPQSKTVNEIVDSAQPATSWKFDNTQNAFGNSRDYAIVASFFDPHIEQHVLIAAGIGKSGTAAAAEFLTTNKYPASWMSQTNCPRDKNVEIILSTEIVEGQQGPPRVVTSYCW